VNWTEVTQRMLRARLIAAPKTRRCRRRRLGGRMSSFDGGGVVLSEEAGGKEKHGRQSDFIRYQL
jgi:hypothetical protein